MCVVVLCSQVLVGTKHVVVCWVAPCTHIPDLILMLSLAFLSGGVCCEHACVHACVSTAVRPQGMDQPGQSEGQADSRSGLCGFRVTFGGRALSCGSHAAARPGSAVGCDAGH